MVGGNIGMDFFLVIIAIIGLWLCNGDLKKGNETEQLRDEGSRSGVQRAKGETVDSKNANPQDKRCDLLRGEFKG